MKNETTFQKKVLERYRFRRAEGHRPSQAILIARHDVRYAEDSKKLKVMPDRHTAYTGTEETELHGGYVLKVEWEYDDDSTPFDVDDNEKFIKHEHYKREEEYWDDWRLDSRHDRGYSYYEFKDALEYAIKEDWNAPPYHVGSVREQAMRAVKYNYEWLRRWYNEDWWYVGMIVTVYKEDKDGKRVEIGEESCCGYDSDSVGYMASEARSWAARIIRDHRSELAERAYWEARDVMTEGA